MLKLQEELRKRLGDDYDTYMSNTIVIAREIALFAHRNQKRLDGSSYIRHPAEMANFYRDITGLNDDGYNDYDEDLVLSLGIPCFGIQEICWLHDVIEDTGYSEEEIRDVYESAGLGRYYNMYIKDGLLLITHDKSEPYPLYIEKVNKNINSALVKFLDLINNSNPITLDHLGDKELDRIQRYASYMKTINDKYHFIEKLNELCTIIKMMRLSKETDS